MAHETVTLDVFKKKVKAGAYDNATAAKRALGRAAEMSDQDKDAARAFADKHFGVEKPAKKATKAPAKKADAKGKTSKPAAKGAAKKGPQKAGASKKAPAKKASKKAA